MIEIIINKTETSAIGLEISLLRTLKSRPKSGNFPNSSSVWLVKLFRQF